MRKKVLVMYCTRSGNTEELAVMVSSLLNSHFRVSLVDVSNAYFPKFDNYDFIVAGSFTWDKGYPSDESITMVEEFESYRTLPNVYIFGTGDYQFGGEDLFCKFTKDLQMYLGSPLPALSIEQSPRGSQEYLVQDWVQRILEEEV